MPVLLPGDRSFPWMDLIPPSWPTKPLKYCTNVNPEALSENVSEDREILYVDVGAVTSTGHILEKAAYLFRDAPSRARRVVRSGDTIVSTVRTYLKAISFITEAEPNLVCSTGFAVLRPGPLVYPKFLYYWVRSIPFVDEICARSTGVSYPAINAYELGSFPCPLLPIEDQAKLAAHLDNKLAHVDYCLESLKELLGADPVSEGAVARFRDNLITAVVFGRVALLSRRTECQ
jgi:type I restriction enzyme, S subunit